MGVKVLVSFILVAAVLLTSTDGVASKHSKPIGSKSVGLTDVGGPLCYCTTTWWSETCYYCQGGEYKCYMCSDGVHCCYDDVPVCCLSTGKCCPADNICCESGTNSCCPENKPVCCEDSENCCEEETTCCGKECCKNDQKCCTDKDNNQYCCGKDVDCCGNQCCTKNTECCEILETDSEAGSKNACLTYHKNEEQSPAETQILTNELFQSLGGNGDLKMLAVAVGQGDCTIIYCPTNNDIVIVDMGASPGAQVVTAVDMKNLLAAYFQTHQNAKMYILITHPNQDHYNYFPTAVTDCADRVNCFVLGGVSQPEQYGKFGQWLQSSVFNTKTYVINEGKPCYGNKNCFIHRPSQKQTQLNPQFCGIGVEFTIMAANQGSTINSRSTVLRVQYGSWSALLPGDFETDAAQTDIVNHYKQPSGNGLQSSCYKIAHHGAADKANFDIFLMAIDPEVAFVSQNYPSESSCHHPRRETIVRLQNVMKVGRANNVPRTEVSPIAYWNTAEKKLQVNTNFCYPIYATCRHSNQCYNIILSSTGLVRYIESTSPLVGVDKVSTDMLDCEDYGDDSSDEYVSENNEVGVSEERAQHPENHQEL